MEPSQQLPGINNRLTQGLQPLADRSAASVAHSMAGQGQYQRALGSFKMCQPGPEHRDGRRSAIDQTWRVPHRSRHAKPLAPPVATCCQSNRRYSRLHCIHAMPRRQNCVRSRGTFPETEWGGAWTCAHGQKGPLSVNQRTLQLAALRVLLAPQAGPAVRNQSLAL